MTDRRDPARRASEAFLWTWLGGLLDVRGIFGGWQWPVDS